MAFYFISWWAFCFFVVIVLLFLIHANIIPALFLGLISWWLNVSPAPLWFKEKVHLTPLNFCQGLKINPELLNWVLNPPQLLISCKSLRAIESPPTQPYIHLNELEEKNTKFDGPTCHLHLLLPPSSSHLLSTICPTKPCCGRTAEPHMRPSQPPPSWLHAPRHLRRPRPLLKKRKGYG